MTTHPVDANTIFADKANLQAYASRQREVIDRIGGPVRLDLTDPADQLIESILIDFPGRRVCALESCDGDGRKVRYRFRTQRRLVAHLLHTGETDRVNSLFLSCRFTAARIGQYNEYLYTFFKCLSQERLQYAEGWYAEQQSDAEDIRLGDWILGRRCPRLKADLTRFGIIDGDTLTCQQHGWQFDLRTGRCLTSAGHHVRACAAAAPSIAT